MTRMFRARVVRADGRTIDVVQRRAHLSYCFTGCCCGRTERGYATVPVDTFKDEWLRRKLWNVAHLTKAGCLGPCALANVASLVFDGRAVWFHSVNTPWHVRLIYDYIETMVEADRFVAPPSELTEYVFNYYDWDARTRTEIPAASVSPGESGRQRIALLSHADTDLLALKRARTVLPPDLDVLGVSLLRVQTDEQLSLLLDGALAGVQVLVLRLHGELDGVPGFDRLRAWSIERTVPLVVVSGTGEPRADFARVSTAGPDVVDAVRTYLTLGGDHNLGECIRFLADRLLLTGYGSAPPLATPEHGVYLPEVENATIADWEQRRDPSKPTAAILFYRAHALTGNVAFIDELIDALEQQEMNALAIFTSSLRARDADGVPAALRLAMDRCDVAISTLSFALGDTSTTSEPSIFERIGVPVLQAVTSGMAREAWEVSRRGLTALDTAINVAIPELDGRIIAPPLSFEDRSEEAPGLYAPHQERAGRIAGMAARLARLRRLPRRDVRVAFVLTNSSSKASQVGNAVGLDAPASLLTLLRAMRRDGYSIDGVPETSDGLMTELLARGSYDEEHPLNPATAERFARSRYGIVFRALPAASRKAAAKLDATRLPIIQQQIWELIQQAQLRADLDLRTMLARDHGDHKHEWDDELTQEGVPATLAEMSGNDVAHLIEDIDGYLCELGTAQIRDGLHALGVMPDLPDTLRALTRLPNGVVPGLQASLACAFGMDLQILLAAPGARFDAPPEVDASPCVSHADAIERLEALARDLFVLLDDAGFEERAVDPLVSRRLGRSDAAVQDCLRFACRSLVPALELVTDEVDHVLDALAGRYVPPGPAGAPTRGMAHILPTGRNFFAVDPRAVPSQAAWRVGEQLARDVLARHLAEEGRYPEMIGLGAWGTSQMRTQGDDVAEVLALLGVEPVWDPQSRRIQDLAVIPIERLGRPRIDVTLRISGFFRDAFPHLITLVDRAVELVVALDEPPDMNFPRKHYVEEVARPTDDPLDEVEARARYRIFGAKPGAYGAGIQHLIDTRHWQDDRDFATVFVEWGGYAYGRGADGADARDVFTDRLRAIEVAVHNQDNREHDIFDSDDYYQFHGGMIASVRSLTGRQPKMYFGDSSRPDTAKVRDLREEGLRVYRSRVVNPKWLASIRRHGYKGGLELAATVNYIFGFDATAHVAPDFVYQGLAAEYALSPEMQEFLAPSNPWALHAIADRLLEAADRGLWENAASETLAALQDVRLKAEGFVEMRGERVQVRS